MTLRWWTETPYFAAMSTNMRPSQSSATEVEQIRRNAELGAAERRRYRIAAERNRIVARHRLLVAGRNLVGEEGDIDIALADEEGFHAVTLKPAYGGSPQPPIEENGEPGVLFPIGDVATGESGLADTAVSRFAQQRHNPRRRDRGLSDAHAEWLERVLDRGNQRSDAGDGATLARRP